MNRFHLAVCVSSFAAASAGAAEAGTLWFANLAGQNENPPNTQPFTGSGFLILNDAETSAVVRVVHDVPNAIDGHIHRGPAGVNGPVIFGFPPPRTSPIGPLTWAIPTAEVANLKSGGLYVNIHTAAFPGGVIRDQLRRALLAPSAAGPAQTAAANALDVSAGFNSDLDQVLMTAAAASPTAKAQIVAGLSAGTLFSQGRQAIEAMHDAETALFSQAGSRAAGDGFGVFARVGESFGSRDAVGGQAGAKVSRTSLMGGVEYVSAGGYVVGAAVGFADGDDKFKAGLGKTNVKTTSVHAFAATSMSGLQFSVVGGYGWVEVDGTRNLTGLGRIADFSPDGKIWSVGAKVQAPVALGDSFDLRPYALIDFHQAKIDGYAETGAGAAGLVVAEHKHKNAAIEAGAAIVLPKREDATWSGRFEAGWRYLLDEGDDDVLAGFAGSPVSFETAFLSPGRSAAHLAATVEGEISPTVTASFGYRGLISKRSDVHMLQLRVSMRLP